MAETPEQLRDRAKDGLRMPPVEEWETFPFEGVIRPRPLEPPATADRSRLGAGGVDCRRCAATGQDYVWTNERWRIFALGLHVCRWGDGSEHLHWWFMARPARLPQLSGTLAAIWDDVLPPLPDEVWRENVDAFRAALG